MQIFDFRRRKKVVHVASIGGRGEFGQCQKESIFFENNKLSEIFIEEKANNKTQQTLHSINCGIRDGKKLTPREELGGKNHSRGLNMVFLH